MIGQLRQLLVAQITDLKHRKIGAFVGQHHVGIKLAAVAQGDPNFIRALDDMIVGHHQPGLAYHHPGPEGILLLLLALAVSAQAFPEKFLEEGIAQQPGEIALLDGAAGVDIDHRRRDLSNHRGIGQQHLLLALGNALLLRPNGPAERQDDHQRGPSQRQGRQQTAGEKRL